MARCFSRSLNRCDFAGLAASETFASGAKASALHKWYPQTHQYFHSSATPLKNVYCKDEDMPQNDLQASEAARSATKRIWAAVDRMANVRHEQAFEAAEDALRRAQDDATRRGESRIVTANEDGFQDCFSVQLRNPRVPVAAVLHSSGSDWSGQWTWTMWAQFLVGPALLLAAYSLAVSWHRWRYGYYHIHQATEDLKSADVCVRWSALDTISNMAQRPQWRRRASDAGVLPQLVDMLQPDLLDIQVIQTDRTHQQQIAYNMLVQVLMTINWIMFDEQGEIVLHKTDLHARLAAALDGPEAWIQWDLARAIARNIKFKLEDPPKRPVITRMYDRVLLELEHLANTFPRFPEHWMLGDRIDDPSLGWRGDKIMQKSDAALEIPGARRRVQRWRSWWNKQEMYPPSVDRWLSQREAFYEAERRHAQRFSGGLVDEFKASTSAAQAGTWRDVAGHMRRGVYLLFSKPMNWDKC